MPPREIIEWTEANSSLPGIGAWGFYVKDGGMLAVAVSPYEQGEVAAKIALNILEEKTQIQTIPIQTSQEYMLYMREASIKEHKLKLPSIYESFARATNNYFDYQ
ncbi:MAG: hypothetical protein AB4426_08870 [Xenococcaceae cyanobacterium]